MKKYNLGFTLIEVVIFIVVSGIIATTILRASSTGLLGSGESSEQINANFLAQQCMEWMLGNRRLNGYNTYTCPSTPTSLLCGTVSGYTVTSNVTCTTLGADTNFKTITVTVSGNANVTLKTLIANY